VVPCQVFLSILEPFFVLMPEAVSSGSFSSSGRYPMKKVNSRPKTGTITTPTFDLPVQQSSLNIIPDWKGPLIRPNYNLTSEQIDALFIRLSGYQRRVAGTTGSPQSRS